MALHCTEFLALQQPTGLNKNSAVPNFDRNQVHVCLLRWMVGLTNYSEPKRLPAVLSNAACVPVFYTSLGFPYSTIPICPLLRNSYLCPFPICVVSKSRSLNFLNPRINVFVRPFVRSLCQSSVHPCAVRRSLFAVRPVAIRRSPFAVRRSPFAVRRSPFVVRRSSFVRSLR